MTEKADAKINAKVSKAEKELKMLKDELELHKETTNVSDSCRQLAEFSEKEEEPFSSKHKQENEWKVKSGGCIIL